MARDEQIAVLGASSSPGSHFFKIVPKRAGGGLPSSRIRARDEKRQPTMGGEIRVKNGIVGGQGLVQCVPSDYSLGQVQNNVQSLYVAIL